MPAFLVVLTRFKRGHLQCLKDPTFHGLFYWVLEVPGLVRWFHWQVEE
jgi:hypothetical protein